MALVKYGSLVTELKGKLGGHVFQQGNTWTVIRTNNKGSDARGFISSENNSFMYQLSVLWGSLSTEDQFSWFDKASLWPVRNKFGVYITVPGFPLFVHLNFDLLRLGVPTLSYCPTPLPSITEYAVTALCSLGANQLEFTSDPTPIAVNEGVILNLYPPERSFWRKKKKVPNKIYVQWLAEQAAKEAYNEYMRKYADDFNPDGVGQFIWFDWYTVSYQTGQRSDINQNYVEIES